MATQRANFTGVSDQKLNVLYKAGRQWYLRLRAAPREVRDAFEPAALPLADPANHTPLSRFTDEVIQHVHRKPEAKL